MNKNNPEYWLSIQPGTQVKLTDLRSLSFSTSSLGIDATIKSAMRLDEINDICKWSFYEIETTESTKTFWLLAKVVDDHIALRIFTDTVIPEMDRKDNIYNSNHFLFQQPKTEDYELLDLEFTTSLRLKDYDYDALNEELYANVTFDPPQSGMKDILATVMEYGSKSKKFPYALLLELGMASNPNGGLIFVRLGWGIEPSDIELI